jgi:hypothetical protein
MKSGTQLFLHDLHGNYAGELNWQIDQYLHTTPVLGRCEVLILSDRLCQKHRRKEIHEHLGATRKGRVGGLLGEYPDDLSHMMRRLVLPKPWTWSLYNVMVIEWREDIAYRVAIGWIYLEAVEKSFELGPQMKEITLG